MANKVLKRALEMAAVNLAGQYGCEVPCHFKHIRCGGKKCVSFILDNFIRKATDELKAKGGK